MCVLGISEGSFLCVDLVWVWVWVWCDGVMVCNLEASDSREDMEVMKRSGRVGVPGT